MHRTQNVALFENFGSECFSSIIVFVGAVERCDQLSDQEGVFVEAKSSSGKFSIWLGSRAFRKAPLSKEGYRLYRELSLQLRNKAPKRRVKAKLREDRTEARQINETWAMDFVHDQLATGRKIRVLTIVDTFSRFSPAVDPRFSYRGEDVVLTLERICKILGYPRTIRVDQGSEFISRDLDIWAYQKGVVLDFSRPGKPTDNSFIESFNGKLRSECLNTHWFLSLDDARQKMEDWRRDYNCASEHPSGYVIEEKRFCWAGCDPAGYFGFCRARSAIV
ncbi:Transposase InsO and inactivated derivatives [Bradyrhizobium shewense]|uniref:Transposase InsO and inactivated derivatives n=1 Tax=Bradyrhizobium shewense TaxID=1761772 RepID=A0A1C3XS74_9BRAD|nr:Transposase InsO and inactivated derivatives [Bradyrhizobium shewense]